MAIASMTPAHDDTAIAPVLAIRRGDSLVRVAEHLDDRAGELDGARRRLLERDCVATRVWLDPGAWVPPSDGRRCEAWLGLLVLDGLLARAVDIEGNRAQELLGPGDVLRPWDDDGASASIPCTSAWRVLEPSSLAVLDDRFAVRAARWPRVGVSLMRAAVRRSHAKSTLLALTRARRADERLMLLFWHLADRWGRVGADGVHVPLRLTHALLADLVCLRRPTVSSTLSQLCAKRVLLRHPDATWSLLGRPG